VSDILAHLALIFDGINIWAALGVTLLAGLMRGFAGFDVTMLMAPVYAMLLGSAGMVVTVLAIELIVSFQFFTQVREDADWKLLTPESSAAFADIPLGVRLLANMDKNAIIIRFSAMIVFFVVIMWTGWRYKRPRTQPATILVGAISGAVMATSSVNRRPFRSMKWWQWRGCLGGRSWAGCLGRI
jgi:uncharacterized membrane protein YfcA